MSLAMKTPQQVKEEHHRAVKEILEQAKMSIYNIYGIDYCKKNPAFVAAMTSNYMDISFALSRTSSAKLEESKNVRHTDTGFK